MVWPLGLKKRGLTDRGVATGVTKFRMASGGSNFVQKASGRTCLLPGVELGGFKHRYVLNIVLKWESRYTLGLNAVKNTHYIKKCFK